VSADHRKPVVAFVVLACLAAALVGVQRADARSGQFFASLVGVTERVEGSLPHSADWTMPGPELPEAPADITVAPYSGSAVTAEPVVARQLGTASVGRRVPLAQHQAAGHGPARALGHPVDVGRGMQSRARRSAADVARSRVPHAQRSRAARAHEAPRAGERGGHRARKFHTKRLGPASHHRARHRGRG
jgi:hypothetical protein